MLAAGRRDLGISDPAVGRVVDHVAGLILTDPAVFHTVNYHVSLVGDERFRVLMGGQGVDEWKLQPARDLGLGPVQRFRSFDRESGLMQTALHQFWWNLVRGYLSFGHRLKVIGRERIPTQPPFLLVANHASHLDALVLAAPLPWRLRDQIFPIAAGDVFFETPAIAAFAAGMLNALPMWRKKCGPHALQQLRQRLLDEPCAYILFPEGARSRDGSLRPFKLGLGMLVAGTPAPVVPCHLGGTYAALRPETRWPKFGERITLRVGEPLVFQAVANKREGWEEIARATRRAVEELAELDRRTNPAQRERR